MTLLDRYPAHTLAGALCLGIAASNAVRIPLAATAIVGGMVAAAAVGGAQRLLLAACALALCGWWWGSMRLDALDRSPMLAAVGRAERSVVVVTGPARRTRFDLRLPAAVRRFGVLRVHEPVLLELPLGRPPPPGAILDLVVTVTLPRGPENGFDEQLWLRRRGVHVVLKASRWRALGARGGLGGASDALRRWLARSTAPGLTGERSAVLEGVVLGDDQGLSDELRKRFRASGLYHLLAVSGQNVALVAGGILTAAWLLGIPRWIGEIGALSGIFAYVLAVGPQPSVVRAGIAGALGSLAWLTARARDRWYFMLVGAVMLLAWNPYTALDAGFQLSFSAVAAIFTLAPRLVSALEGYPLPRGLAGVLALSTACGLATAPVLWFQFGAIPLLSVPANAIAAPVIVPLLGLALAAAVVGPVSPATAAVLAWLNGWCAAYLAGCARLVGGLPFAQVRSPAAVAALTGLALLAAAYAWSRWPS